MPEHQWYRRVTDDPVLMQGDLIYKCPYVIPPRNASIGNHDINIIEYDVIILTQSCDLGKPRIKHVLVSPFWTLNEYETIFPAFRDNNLKESAKRGYQPALVILDKLNSEDFLVVDFKDTYSVPVETLRDLIVESPIRWRLDPPYREHLSQEFAKFFMRVGLPKEIPHFSAFNIDYCDECPIHHAVRE